jgi:hypothetical protein
MASFLKESLHRSHQNLIGKTNFIKKIYRYKLDLVANKLKK